MASPGVLNLTFIWTVDDQEPDPFQWYAPVRNDEYTLPLEFWEDEAATVPYVIDGPFVAQLRPALLDGPTAGPPITAFTITQLTDNTFTLILEPAKTLILPGGWRWDFQADATTLVGGKGKTQNDVSRAGT